MSRIVWLASYPKSGNTWLRAFLANFENDGSAPANINNLALGGISSSRPLADDALGIECADLTHEEIDLYRPAFYRSMAARSAHTLLVKTHDAYTINSEGEPLFPSDVTKGVLYLIRNPLDVAVSFAYHRAEAFDETIARMGRESSAFADRPDRLHIQLRQRLLSWSGHVLSWLDQRALRLHVMRYEDMCLHPIKTFMGAVRFLGMDENPDRVRRAVDFSSFEKLRCQEQKFGFKESPHGTAAFFRNGRAAAWRDALTNSQAERVMSDHGEVMGRFGYLSRAGAAQ